MSSWPAGSRSRLGGCRSSQIPPRSRWSASPWRRTPALMSGRSGPPSSGTGASAWARTSSIDTDAIPTSRSNPCTRPSLAAAGRTSTSACRRSGGGQGRGRARGGRTPGRRDAGAPLVDARVAREPRRGHRGLAGLRRRRQLTPGGTWAAGMGLHAWLSLRFRASPISPMPALRVAGEHAGGPVRDVLFAAVTAGDHVAEVLRPRDIPLAPDPGSVPAST